MESERLEEYLKKGLRGEEKKRELGRQIREDLRMDQFKSARGPSAARVLGGRPIVARALSYFWRFMNETIPRKGRSPPSTNCSSLSCPDSPSSRPSNSSQPATSPTSRLLPDFAIMHKQRRTLRRHKRTIHTAGKTEHCQLQTALTVAVREQEGCLARPKNGGEETDLGLRPC